MVQVPRLQKLQPGTSQSGPSQRIQAVAPDTSGIIAQQAGDLAQLGKQGIDLYEQIENKKVAQLSDQAEINYANWNQQQLIKLKDISGDPSSHYEAYEEEERKYSEKMMEGAKDVSPRVKRLFEAKFNTMRAKRRSGVIKQRELQKQAYDKSLYDSKLKLNKEDLPLATSSVKVGDDESLAEFEVGLSDINKTIIRRGVDQGTIEIAGKDEKGNPIYRFKDDISKYTMVKERSEAIANSIDVLINQGDAEKAQFMLDKYGVQIEPVAKSKLIKKLKKDNQKSLAYDKYDKIRSKSQAEQLRLINNISDGELRGEVVKIKEAEESKIQSMKNRSSKDNYNSLASRVLKKMSGNDPYNGVADLENDPVYKRTWGNITDANQQKAILEMIKSPKSDSDGSVFRVQKLLFGTDEDFKIETITPEEFAGYLTGLSKETRKRYTKEFERLRTETSAEQRANYNFSRKILIDKMLKAGEVRKNSYGKFNRRNEKKIIEATDELMGYMQEQYGTFNVKQTEEFINEYIKARVEEKVFDPEPRRPDLEKPLDDIVMSSKERIELSRKYKDRYGDLPDTKSNKFKRFVKRERGN